MDIMELGALGELAGGVAVIVTLVFLTVEIRRNTTATRRATQQSQVDQVAAVNLSTATGSQLASLIVQANDDYDALAPAEQLQLQTFYVNYFNLWDAAFWNRKEGVLDDQGFGVWNKGVICILTHQAASRKAWDVWGHVYADEFRDHVEALIAEIGAVEGPGAFAPVSPGVAE